MKFAGVKFKCNETSLYIDVVSHEDVAIEKYEKAIAPDKTHLDIISKLAVVLVNLKALHLAKVKKM